MYYGAWLGLHRKADTKFYWADDTPLTAILHGMLVNRTIHQVRSVAKFTAQDPQKESGMTRNVP